MTYRTRRAFGDQSLAVAEIYHTVENTLLTLLKQTAAGISELSPEVIQVLSEVAESSKDSHEWLRGLSSKFILAAIHRFQKESGQIDDAPQKKETPAPPPPPPTPPPRKKKPKPQPTAPPKSKKPQSPKPEPSKPEKAPSGKKPDDQTEASIVSRLRDLGYESLATIVENIE